MENGKQLIYYHQCGRPVNVLFQMEIPLAFIIEGKNGYQIRQLKCKRCNRLMFLSDIGKLLTLDKKARIKSAGNDIQKIPNRSKSL